MSLLAFVVDVSADDCGGEDRESAAEKEEGGGGGS